MNFKRTPYVQRFLKNFLGLDHVRPSQYMFALSVYQELHLLPICLKSIRAFHPDAPIVVISDGDLNSEYESICHTYRAKFVLGERVKLPGCGGRYLNRFFETLLSSSMEYLIKIDADSMVHRPFRYLLNADFYGTYLWPNTWGAHIQGGAQVLSRKLCERLVASGLSLSQQYASPEMWVGEPRLLKQIQSYESRTGLLNADFMLFHMAQSVGARIEDWEEVLCLASPSNDLAKGNYAITHPHKTV